ncbi:MAG: polyprenyl synthetase family protein [Betaproteobacteria bacterium]|jgi:geranylgeranyl diphosphate synthase type II|nr:polyprenyl synthetase family protein [Betaproteobacteria bacterium]NBZ99474.1 polyprenyl synthetase family protein [Betaproteobacteria bacterium]NDB44647.1 polyprenyl synthetase family protein [Betaproteobacteria bacterium]NDD00910.1 polyprenyl synthetase family protein [Betaproteobacteria bacterium]NDD24475.1 polyprenyl synthetase family protein [Betaproteobacteria bacterium]
MSLLTRAEAALKLHFDAAAGNGAPQRLQAAMKHAVFSGGARIRPQLCMAVATACGDDAPELTNAAAVALEFMHCASLVHDDMPTFDNADFRRGQPTVHKAFSEPLALLTGDGLIVMAYQALLQAGRPYPDRLIELMDNLSKGVGLPNGIVAGQAWECETTADLGQYQRAKTGALFVSATCAGAIASGQAHAPWAPLGAYLGEAYQVADDIRDVLGDVASLGKPAGQDVLNARPSSAQALGLEGAIHHFDGLIAKAGESIPDCNCRDMLKQLVLRESERLVPKSMCEDYRKQAALVKAVKWA